MGGPIPSPEFRIEQVDFDFSGSGRLPGLKFQLIYDAAEPGEAAGSDKLPPLHDTFVGR